MALISCPECGKEISDKAFACPHCGNPMNPQPQQLQQPQQEEYLSCPKCGSHELHAEHKGFSGGKALEKAQEINEAVEEFNANAAQILIKIKSLLANNIKNPKDALNRVSISDITRANYDDMEFKPTDNNGHCIGLFLLKERYADACRFCIDLAGNDDINRAKNFINDVYDMISFNNQSFFVIVAKRLVELKVLGREDDAVNEFAYYALCSREIARQVIDML